MTLLQTLLIAIIQGVTELFPISSVAHAVLTPALFRWDLDPQFLKEHFLPFVVMLHLGTALALLLFFWRDWLAFAASLVDRQASGARRELLLVAIGTVPAALIGLVFESRLRAIFPSVASAGFFLIVNGVILYAGERLRGRGTRQLAELGPFEALLIGLAQSLALIPGFSRSGASMVAGVLGRARARGGGALLDAAGDADHRRGEPRRAAEAHARPCRHVRHGGAGAGAAAGLVAFASVWALMRWFRRNEVNAMLPFAVYCWLAGALVLAFL